jgi:hypothetical protein
MSMALGGSRALHPLGNAALASASLKHEREVYAPGDLTP